jgi:hypothetical protein
MEYGVWFALDVGHREQQHPYRTPELGVPAVGGPAKEDRIGLAAVGATTVLVTLRMSDEHTCTHVDLDGGGGFDQPHGGVDEAREVVAGVE